MPRLPFQWALAIVCGLLLASLFRGASADDAVTSSSEAALAAHPGILRWRAKLLALDRAWSAKWHASQRRADSLRAVLPESLPQFSPDTALLSAARAWKDYGEARQAEAQQCSVVVKTCEQRAALAEQEADTLAKRLGAQIEVGRCHVLFVPCPTRWQSALVGFLLGGVLTFEATK